MEFEDEFPPRGRNGRETLLPEIEEFFKSNADSDLYYTAKAEVSNAHPVPLWSDDWNATERAAFYEAEKARRIAILEFEHEQREKRIVALEVLKNHQDPVIKWLVTDRVINRDYTGYRDEVLKALPMNREQMEQFGDRKGWCSDYQRMLERAERAGVLPEPTPKLSNIDELVKALTDWYGGHSRRFRNEIKAHLPKIIESYETMKAEREKAEAEKAAAAEKAAETPTVDSTPADVQPRRRSVPVRNPDGTFAGSVTVAA